MARPKKTKLPSNPRQTIADTTMKSISDVSSLLYSDENSHRTIDSEGDPYPLQLNCKTANITDYVVPLYGIAKDAQDADEVRSYVIELTHSLYNLNAQMSIGMVNDIVRSLVVAGFHLVANFDYGFEFDKNQLIKNLGAAIENLTADISGFIMSINVVAIKRQVAYYFNCCGTTIDGVDPARRSAAIDACTEPFAVCVATDATMKFCNSVYACLAPVLYYTSEAQYDSACNCLNPVFDEFHSLAGMITSRILFALIRDRTESMISVDCEE